MRFLKGVRSKKFLKSKRGNSSAPVVDESNSPSFVAHASSFEGNPHHPPHMDDEIDATEVGPANNRPGSYVPSSHRSRRDDTSRTATAAAAAASRRPLHLGSFNFDDPPACRNVDRATRTTFPDLHREANDMMYLSNLTYVLIGARRIARENNNDDGGDASAGHGALECILAGGVTKRGGGEEGEGRKSRDGGNGTLFDWMRNWDGCLGGGFSFDELFCGGDLGAVFDGGRETTGGKDEVSSSMIFAIGDPKHAEGLGYAIEVNNVMERVTVIFMVRENGGARFVSEYGIAHVRAPDPRTFDGAEFGNSHIDVGVHRGVYEYLLGGGDGNTSKYTEITKIVEEVMHGTPAHKNYKLYVTGHSLGGALATLFGFYVASSSVVPFPVTVVSVASPRVGNIAFARTFAEMESQGKIRHLRIANYGDPVTLGPIIGSKLALALSDKSIGPLEYTKLMVAGQCEGEEEEIYYDTGIKMKLLNNVPATNRRKYHLSYSGSSIIARDKKPVAIDEGDMAELEQTTAPLSELQIVSNHYSKSYSDRLALVESDCKGLSLNTVYREKALGFCLG
ncbi:hypothetical protein ACHAXA_005994 [Cyclostephanos tholiformis]|uniref:Fungal lipase-type domain-containing protein n=1 Tax=Cyclostephanos tholiformis TaxID=382380 RepID=A0ABD3SQM3_9STRA